MMETQINYQSLLDEAEAFVSVRLAGCEEQLVYHNLAHTRGVVNNASQIAAHYQLTETDRFVVLSASWFHDLGYINGAPAGHEQRGVSIFREFAQTRGIDNDLVEHVEGCVLATTLPQKPATLLEAIVCDADLYHFGTADFFEKDALMLRETQGRLKTKNMATSDWLAGTLKLLQSHQFCTLYCQQQLVGQKEENIRRLETRLQAFPEVG
jgi:predicted metal-dependent HD superfamily phosphohydrolase